MRPGSLLPLITALLLAALHSVALATPGLQADFEGCLLAGASVVAGRYGTSVSSVDPWCAPRPPCLISHGCRGGVP